MQKRSEVLWGLIGVSDGNAVSLNGLSFPRSFAIYKSLQRSAFTYPCLTWRSMPDMPDTRISGWTACKQSACCLLYTRRMLRAPP